MNTCPRCRNGFACGMSESDATQPCWCAGLPPLPLDPGAAAEPPACYCPACLRELIAEPDAAPKESG